MNSHWHEGYEAYPDTPLIGNPYSRHTPAAASWEDGWKERFFEVQQEDKAKR